MEVYTQFAKKFYSAEEMEAYKKKIAEERELEADSRERIKRAVTAHENRIAELEALIELIY